MSKYVSVYGTLRKGERANYMLDNCEFIGATIEKLPFIMVNLGSFPALLESEVNNQIVLETYKFPEEPNMIEARLDSYEGYQSNGNGLYDKKSITLASGIESSVYFMKRDSGYDGNLIKSGDWKNK